MVQESEAIGLLACAWEFTNWIDENYPEIYDKYSKLKVEWKMHKTSISKCDATDCQHNSLNRCKFWKIVINKDFECSNFKSMHED